MVAVAIGAIIKWCWSNSSERRLGLFSYGRSVTISQRPSCLFVANAQTCFIRFQRLELGMLGLKIEYFTNILFLEKHLEVVVSNVDSCTSVD